MLNNRILSEIKLRNLIDGIIKNEVIKEGLIISYPPNKIIQFLESIQLKRENDFDIINENNRTIFVILTSKSNNIISNYNKINDKLQNLYGWIHASTEKVGTLKNELLTNRKDFLKDTNNVFQYLLHYEPKFDLLLSTKNESDNKIYYHLTNEFNLKKILKIGLIPKPREYGFSYGNEKRIYFVDKSDDNFIFNLVKNLHNLKDTSKKSEKDNRVYENYVLLKLSLNNIDVYQDVNYVGGYYVVDNIPPQNITPINKYVFDIQNNKINKIIS
jgi:hypothetical protein